jgi:hypothetical protein
MLPAQGQMAFALSQQFAATNQQSGLLEFYSAGGSIAILALRFNPTGAFTAAPVYSESGPPIIGASSGGGGGTLPQFSVISLFGNTCSAGGQTFFAGGAAIILFGPRLRQRRLELR